MARTRASEKRDEYKRDRRSGRKCLAMYRRSPNKGKKRCMKYQKGKKSPFQEQVFRLARRLWRKKEVSSWQDALIASSTHYDVTS